MAGKGSCSLRPGLSDVSGSPAKRCVTASENTLASQVGGGPCASAI